MKELFIHWQVDGSSVVLLLLLVGIGFFVRDAFRNACFWVAVLMAVLCFCSPLYLLSSHYLFSAHMVVHVLLLMAVGPMLLLSLSERGKNFSAFFLFLKKHPVLGWLTGLGAMWFWHVPLIFNTAMGEMHRQGFSFLAVLESCSLIMAGILFAAPVLHPNKEYRMDALSGVVYLFTACIGCSLLGLLITFAPAGTYHHFLSHHDPIGLNKIILRAGITQATDQQAAGLIMWVPCCLLYVSVAMYLLVQWFGQKEVVSSIKRL
jgi:cytochrome c oxidase assembly factor CtaG